MGLRFRNAPGYRWDQDKKDWTKQQMDTWYTSLYDYKWNSLHPWIGAIEATFEGEYDREAKMFKGHYRKPAFLKTVIDRTKCQLKVTDFFDPSNGKGPAPKKKA